jgi:hypothetical protein
MQIKPPSNTEKYFWTKHSIMKMQHYGLSAQRILRVLKSPQRKEEGIVPRTVAVMQPTSVSTKNGKRVWSSEIWAMYQTRGAGNLKSKISNSKQIQNPKFKIINSANRQVRIISAWRYPGVSPERDPIPEEILREISELSAQAKSDKIQTGNKK